MIFVFSLSYLGRCIQLFWTQPHSFVALQ